MKSRARKSAVLLAATSLTVCAALSFAADSASPAQSDNQMNGMAGSMSNTNNNAGAAVNNGGLVDNAANTNSPSSAGDAVRNKVDQAGAGTPTADNPAPDARAIRRTLGKVTGEALEKDDLDDLVDYFTSAAKDRIKKSDSYSQNYGNQLDGRIEQINTAWKQKFGHAFKVGKANQTLGDEFATIQQGVVGKDTDLALMATADSADSKIEDGRSIAVVTVKAMQGMSDLKVPLIHELPDSWKFNVPGDLDAAKLRQNLTDHLTALGDHLADWPTDEAAAERVVVHHVLMAVMGKPVEWTGASGSTNTGAMGNTNMGK
jgi:hypothetical protein